MYFDTQNGWIQFVFANEHDKYYLPGMLEVDLDRYLLYCLKRSDYRSVFFWKENSEGNELLYMDDNSARAYGQIQSKLKPKSFMDRFLGGGSSEEYVKGRKRYEAKSPGDMEKIFYKIVDGRERTAFLIPLTTFDTFFSADPARRKQLTARYRENRIGQEGLILLVGSTLAEKSNKLFTREDSLLAELFDEVERAAKPDTVRDLYTRLKDNLGNKCLFLNSMSADMIRAIVYRNSFFEEEGKLPPDREMAEKVTLVIERWYHSRYFRNAERKLLPENRTREYLLLDRELRKSQTCERLLSWIRNKEQNLAPGERLPEYLKNHYTRTSEGYVYTESVLLRDWDRIALPASVPSEKRENYRRAMAGCRNLLENLVLQGDGEREQEKLKTCIGWLLQDQNDDDAAAFEDGLKAMRFLLEDSARSGENREKIWTFYENIQELSANLCTLRQDERDSKRKLQTEYANFTRKMNELKQLEQRGSRDEITRLALNKQLDDSNRQMKEREVTLNLNREKQRLCGNAIKKLESAIEQLEKGVVVDMDELMRQVSEVESRSLEKSIEFINNSQSQTDYGFYGAEKLFTDSETMGYEDEKFREVLKSLGIDPENSISREEGSRAVNENIG